MPQPTPAATQQDELTLESQPSQHGDGAAVPLDEVRPVLPNDSVGGSIVALAKYMMCTEVHTYAFSVAANVILSLFPFIVMMMTLTRHVFNSVAMFNVVQQMMWHFLPANQEFIIRNMKVLANPHKGVQIYSLVMLIISSTGVFLPLEVALNRVWGVKENRSYLHNQLISIGLALGVGVLAMGSVAISTAQQTILGVLFFHHIDNGPYRFLAGTTLGMLGGVLAILIFFLIYWVLPNRKIPARAVLPTAIVTGLLWQLAKALYVMVLPKLDFAAVYGPFYVSVGLMIWAFLSGLLLLAGAHFSATRYALSVAREEDKEDTEKRDHGSRS
ncbi:MAG TPA: YihY/virulence factor BrkB family protein [Bryobacteraceae bacterium]